MVMSICEKYKNNTYRIYNCKRKNKQGCDGCKYHLYNESTSANWDLESIANAVVQLMELDKNEKRNTKENR